MKIVAEHIMWEYKPETDSDYGGFPSEWLPVHILETENGLFLKKQSLEDITKQIPKTIEPNPSILINVSTAATG